MKIGMPIYDAKEDVIESLATLQLNLAQKKANDLVQDVIAIHNQLKLIQGLIGIQEASTKALESILSLAVK